MASITVANADKLADSTSVKISSSDKPFNTHSAYYTLLRSRERALKTDWYMSLFDERSVASNRRWATALGQPTSKATQELLKFMRWLGYGEGLEGAPAPDFPELTKVVTDGIVRDLTHRHTAETTIVVRSPDEMKNRDDFDTYQCE